MNSQCQLQVRFVRAPGHPPLFVRQVTPKAARARLLFLHGSLVHSEYDLPWALALAFAGFEVWLPDLRVMDVPAAFGARCERILTIWARSAARWAPFKRTPPGCRSM